VSTALALALAGVLVTGAILWLRPAATPLWSGVLLGGPELAQYPRLSPDGHTLAFLTTSQDIFQLAVMKPESGNWTLLTHAPDKGYIGSLTWSPDGTRIYYDRWTDVPRGVYSVPVLGGVEQLVLEDAGDPEAMADGTILMARYNAQRRLQLIRLWPDTGRVQEFPLETSTVLSSLIRAFPDGKQAVAIGTRIGPGHELGPQPYLVDMQSGGVRLLAGARGASYRSLAVTRDGKSILAVVDVGNLAVVTSISRDGRRLVPSLLTLTNTLYSLDSGPDGSIYVDQVERGGELRRFSPQGGASERVALLPPYEAPGSPSEDSENFAVLPDGRAVIGQGTGGQTRLMIAETGKDPVPLLNSNEPNSAPVTAAGPDAVAFLLGPPQHQGIALASVSTGRILRRLNFDKTPVTSLAASPDGKTLYCAAAGMVWSIPSEGGEAKKIRAGDYVAVDPSSRSLLVELVETPIIRFIQVPLDGGPEREIPRPGPERPAFLIGPNSVGKDGRVLMVLGTFTGFWPAGILDPVSGKLSVLPVDRKLDYHVLNWTPDGKVLALGLDMRSRLWRFQPRKAE